MIIRRITLTNFRRFNQLDLDDLPVGLIGIIGENGSGKSTILEAVGWALYGTYALTGRTEKEGVKTQGVGVDENCEVTLEFEMAEDTYKIVRRLHGKRALAQAFIYKNGEFSKTYVSIQNRSARTNFMASFENSHEQGILHLNKGF